jgi:hypothetical protein
VPRVRMRPAKEPDWEPVYMGKATRFEVANIVPDIVIEKEPGYEALCCFALQVRDRHYRRRAPDGMTLRLHRRARRLMTLPELLHRDLCLSSEMNRFKITISPPPSGDRHGVPGRRAEPDGRGGGVLHPQPRARGDRPKEAAQADHRNRQLDHLRLGWEVLGGWHRVLLPLS